MSYKTNVNYFQKCKNCLEVHFDKPKDLCTKCEEATSQQRRKLHKKATDLAYNLKHKANHSNSSRRSKKTYLESIEPSTRHEGLPTEPTPEQRRKEWIRDFATRAD
jgi:hypothetical protein